MGLVALRACAVWVHARQGRWERGVVWLAGHSPVQRQALHREAQPPFSSLVQEHQAEFLVDCLHHIQHAGARPASRFVLVGYSTGTLAVQAALALLPAAWVEARVSLFLRLADPGQRPYPALMPAPAVGALLAEGAARCRGIAVASVSAGRGDGLLPEGLRRAPGSTTPPYLAVLTRDVPGVWTHASHKVLPADFGVGPGSPPACLPGSSEGTSDRGQMGSGTLRITPPASPGQRPGTHSTAAGRSSSDPAPKTHALLAVGRVVQPAGASPGRPGHGRRSVHRARAGLRTPSGRHVACRLLGDRGGFPGAAAPAGGVGRLASGTARPQPDLGWGSGGRLPGAADAGDPRRHACCKLGAD